MSHSNSNSNSNTDSNTQNSANASSNVSRSSSPYGDPLVHQYNVLTTQMQPQTQDRVLGLAAGGDPLPFSRHSERIEPDDSFRPSTTTVVYIVTSAFTSQTTPDGVRLSESDIVGFQILAVFARIEDANSYAEHECEEIDAGVRLRRRRRIQGGPVGFQEGEGIRAEAIIRDDGTISWNVEDVGQIEVGQWVVQ